MRNVDVQTEIVIKCPIEKVAAFASDPDNATRWYVNIKAVEWKTPKPLKLGSLVAFKAKFLGKELAYTYEIVENIPNKKFVMRTADGPFPMETTYEWEKINENVTRMKLRNRGTPSGFSKLFAPFMISMMRKANTKDLIKLRSILES
jgi:uncharacterized membrane protein